MFSATSFVEACAAERCSIRSELLTTDVDKHFALWEIMHTPFCLYFHFENAVRNATSDWNMFVYVCQSVKGNSEEQLLPRWWSFHLIICGDGVGTSINLQTVLKDVFYVSWWITVDMKHAGVSTKTEIYTKESGIHTASLMWGKVSMCIQFSVRNIQSFVHLGL